jgi:hypothetical protein
MCEEYLFFFEKALIMRAIGAQFLISRHSVRVAPLFIFLYEVSEKVPEFGGLRARPTPSTIE